MAASLGQEFCTLRDTYIEKQFGRLNDMQRQAADADALSSSMARWTRSPLQPAVRVL